MNKNDIITKLADVTGLPKVRISEIFDSLISVIEEAMVSGDKVTIPGFGAFSTAIRPARIGRNPKTMEEIKIPAKKAMKFTPGKQLKLLLNPEEVAKPSKAKK